MIRRLIILCIMYLFSFNLCSQEFKKIKSLNLPRIEEKVLNSTYSFYIEKGVPYILGSLVFEGYTEQHKALFIIDTGIAFSYIYSNKLDDIEIEKKQYEQDTYLICTADFQNFAIKNFYVFLNPKNNSRVFNCEYDLIGVLGNDVLTQKNFYISLTKKEFSWKDNLELEEPENINTYYLNNIKMQKGGINYFWHTVFVEDNFFDNRTYPLFQMMPEQRGSRYWIGTGNYEIITSNFDFEEQISRHNYKNEIIRNEKGKIDYGSLVIKKATLFGKKFNNLKAITSIDSFYGLSSVKVLGTQVLAAFDLYFITGVNNNIEKILFYPVNNMNYKKFLEENK